MRTPLEPERARSLVEKLNCGIYLITNSANGKVYVGKSVNLIDRRSDHFWSLRDGSHGNSHLQAAWNKYGSSAFSFYALQYCAEEDLKVWEDWWMSLLDSRNRSKGYNKRDAIHYRHSEDSKRKMAIASTGKVKSPETLAKMSAYMKGNQFRAGIPHTSETRAKMSAERKGKPKSPEHRAKIAAAHRGKTYPKATHCKKGHEFTPDNIIVASNGRRSCRKCRKDWDRRRYYASKAQRTNQVCDSDPGQEP